MTTIELMDDEFAITFGEKGDVKLYVPTIVTDEDNIDDDVLVPKMYMYIVALFTMLNSLDDRLFQLLDQRIDELNDEIVKMNC